MRKTERTWTSESGKTNIVARLLSESDQEFFPGKRMSIIITHNYGDYFFDGQLRNNTATERRYSKSNRLSYGIAWGKEFFKTYF